MLKKLFILFLLSPVIAFAQSAFNISGGDWMVLGIFGGLLIGFNALIYLILRYSVKKDEKIPATAKKNLNVLGFVFMIIPVIGTFLLIILLVFYAAKYGGGIKIRRSGGRVSSGSSSSALEGGGGRSSGGGSSSSW